MKKLDSIQIEKISNGYMVRLDYTDKDKESWDVEDDRFYCENEDVVMGMVKDKVKEL